MKYLLIILILTFISCDRNAKNSNAKVSDVLKTSINEDKVRLLLDDYPENGLIKYIDEDGTVCYIIEGRQSIAIDCVKQ